MELYWLPLMRNLKNYMVAAKDRVYKDQLMFAGVDIGIGGGGDTYPRINLIWAGEYNIPKINQGTRTVDLWIDCWSKYVKSDTEEFCYELYEMQRMVMNVLNTWPEYLQTYTFPGGKHFGVVLEVKKLCSDGMIAPPSTASRFIVGLSVKESIHTRMAVLNTVKK